jgi:peptide/nickel transport system substrate-binding protein
MGRLLPLHFLATNREQERLALAYQTMLAPLGITMTIRSVDSAQYQERLKNFDFDMIHFVWRQSLSPGNEQYGRWAPQSAEREGSFNMAGVTSPVVKKLIDALLAAKDRPSFEQAARALDIVLRQEYLMIPLFHTDTDWVAHWALIGKPGSAPLLGYDTNTWWHESVTTKNDGHADTRQ